MVEVENVGLQLAGWILNQKIVEHIFGPNLHVEVIKQSHVLLNFLAVEGKITNEHINVIWQASQLKHCSKQVHDLLLPLIKNLEAGPVLHLYDLLKELPVKVKIEKECTVWKFQDFTITQILREINFQDFRSAKSAILTHSEVLMFYFCAFLHIYRL